MESGNGDPRRTGTSALNLDDGLGDRIGHVAHRAEQRQPRTGDHGTDGGDHRRWPSFLHVAQFTVIADDIVAVWAI